VLTDSQLASWVRGAGWQTLDEMVTAIAIAYAESSGRIDAKNTNLDGSVDYGVWQINSVHADLFAKYPEWWTVSNAVMAYELYKSKGNKFTDWVTYNTGAYKMFTSHARAAASDVSAPANTDLGDAGVAGSDQTTTTTIIPGVDAIASSLAAFSTATAAVASWVSDVRNWERVGMVLIGGALVVGALVMVAGKEVSGPLENVAGKVLRAAA
jgi:hypothetical protein